MLVMQFWGKLNNSFYKFQLKAYTEVKKNWHSIRELNVKLLKKKTNSGKHMFGDSADADSTDVAKL